MSIFNDKNLRQFLAAEGSKFINKFGQSLAPDDYISYEIAQPLLVQLQRQIDPDNAPKTSLLGSDVTEAGDGFKPELPEIKAANLRTIDDLLTWCYDNKITWSGKQIVFGASDSHPDDSWQFDGMTFKRSRDTLGKPITNGYYVSKDELVQFLVFLKDSQEARTNKVLEVMLGKIIGQLNKYLDTPIDSKAKTESKKTDLSPSTIVDGFTGAIDSSSWQDGTEGFPTFNSASRKILVQDISSIDNLKKWLQFSKIKTDAGEFFVFDAKNGDPCSAVAALYKRAQFYSSKADDSKKSADYYLSQMKDLGSQIEWQGKACSVTSGATISTTESSGSSMISETGGKKSAEKTSELVNKVCEAMPLVLWTYNYPKIATFLPYIEELMPEQVPAYKAEIEKYNGYANQNLNTENQIMYLANADQVSAFTKNPQAALLAYLDHIKRVTELTQGLINTFKQMFKQELDKPANSSGKAKVNQQIDPSSGIAYQNINQIQHMIQDRKGSK